MANFNIADLKALREQLGTGMSDTKAALVEADGDIEKATEILRLKGAKGNAKRADRSTSEGLIAAREGEGTATMIALACETDFVAKNEKFVALADRVVDAAAAVGANSVDEGLNAPLDGKTVREVIEEQAATIGEKLELGRAATVAGDKFAVYLHRTSKDLPPQVGVVLAYSGDDAETARAVAQHIAMFAPEHINRDEVPADVVEKERELAAEIARGEGKPEAALPKIVEGRLTGFFKQTVLLDQAYARDSKQSVGQVVEAAGVTVTGFARFKIGS
ncbi:MAG TPA: translation elongation factor Ts [Candidatus Agrococcus pullicola]|uniref:Elongation factor Ts n=1 Tax=Candidatus Agrococcus pullicola TaxID=2838429 RepID=A0A9D1YWU5_9MICO|nr:translation elongation factor Ts [Candidatus Agrococcus pullicola]